MTSAQGEDRSSFQAVGPWKNLDFGWCKATEGTGYTDPAFAANWRNLDSQVAHRGAYHFFHPAIDATAQARHFMTTVIDQGLQRGDMLAIDAEIAAGVDGTQITTAAVTRRSALLYCDNNGKARNNPGLKLPHRLLRPSMPPRTTTSNVGNGALEFLEIVSALVRGHLGGDYCPVLVYSYVAFLPQLAPCTEYPLWAAYFASTAPHSVAPWDVWTMWQYAGGGGQLGSDQDAYNGTSQDLDADIATYVGSTPAPAPPPAPASWETALMNSLPELKQGSKDYPGQVQYVHRVQWIAAGLATVRHIPAAAGLTADGIFGPKTTAAVKAIQANFGFPPAGQDGIVGPKTWTVLYTGA